MKVLVLEDDDLVSSLLAEELSEAGHQVLGPAETVAGAFSIIAQGHMPDLALVDIRLRYGSRGTEFVKEVRQRFDFPCIFVSSEASEAFLHRHLALGYIGKPYPPAHIVECVAMAEELIGGRQPEHIPAGFHLFAEQHDPVR